MQIARYKRLIYQGNARIGEVVALIEIAATEKLQSQGRSIARTHRVHVDRLSMVAA